MTIPIWLWFCIVPAGVLVLAFAWTKLRDASYRRKGILPRSSQATMTDVERLVRDGKRIEAIRVYREIYPVGLAEAKKAIEDLHVP